MAHRSVDDIRADLAANRAKLADATAEAMDAVKPQNIARESVSQVKQFAKAEFDAATTPLRDERGAWRADKLLLIGGAVLGVVVFAVTLSSIANRRTVAASSRRALER